MEKVYYVVRSKDGKYLRKNESKYGVSVTLNVYITDIIWEE